MLSIRNGDIEAFWEPADKLRKDDGKRVLHDLPLYTLCKFQNATWVVDERLGSEVWPPYPLGRTWVLNETLGTKIRRKGFTLFADYASTAFVIQGATLADPCCPVSATSFLALRNI